MPIKALPDAVVAYTGISSLNDLQCDPARGQVWTGQDTVAIGPRGARILTVLLQQKGQIVATASLIEAGWPGFTIEESSLAVEIASLRRALQRLLGGTQWIISIPRRGYRLLTDIDADRRPVPGRWETPTIAVLPLSLADGLGPEAAPARNATTMTATLTDVIGLHAGLSVTPANLAALYAETRIGADAIAADLGVRYLLEGKLFPSEAETRLALTLKDTIDGRIIWSASFENTDPRPQHRHQMLAAQVVQGLDELLVRGEEARSGYLPTRNLQAWTHYIRGFGHAYWPRHDMRWGSEILLALEEWKKALDLDPESPELLATIGAGHAVLAAYPSIFAMDAAPELAQQFLAAALEGKADHPVALAYHALMLAEADRFDEAAAVARHAIAQGPHSPSVTAVAAVALCAGGAAAEAVQAVERTLSATPHFPSIYSPPLARAWRSVGRVDEAIRFLEAMDDEPHKFDGRELILCYAQAGRMQDAVNAATRLLLQEPGFTVSGWLETQHRNDAAAIAADAEALRSVGLPE